MGSQAQNNELPQEPPPPPVPPKIEMEKFTPPVIVKDKEVNMVPPSAPPLPPSPPVPPKVKMTTFTPPKIVKVEVDVPPPLLPPPAPLSKSKKEIQKLPPVMIEKDSHQ